MMRQQAKIDETMASAGKKTSPEWERILGADLADDTETARSTPPYARMHASRSSSVTPSGQYHY